MASRGRAEGHRAWTAASLGFAGEQVASSERDWTHAVHLQGAPWLMSPSPTPHLVGNVRSDRSEAECHLQEECWGPPEAPLRITPHQLGGHPGCAYPLCTWAASRPGRGFSDLSASQFTLLFDRFWSSYTHHDPSKCLPQVGSTHGHVAFAHPSLGLKRMAQERMWRASRYNAVILIFTSAVSIGLHLLGSAP